MLVEEQPHILIVDDEEAVCWALHRGLSQEGYSAEVTGSAEEAFARASSRRPDAVILDVRLPGMDGLDALTRLRDAAGDVPVIIITAFGSLNTAVRAVQGGAFDYLTKPFDLDQALSSVRRALLRGRNLDAGVRELAVVEPDEIVGSCPAMQAMFRRIALVAPRDACVLITGESGTGKELVARAIHRHGPRADQPFVPVHLAALNPSLVESELFGHVKGAFTGAEQTRPGLLALADGGTVFLDELADIPLSVQIKLLRALEHGEILPVGSTRPQKINVRLLAATHQDLFRKVADGSFRHDLFFRLNVFQISLPPLRERREDIPLLLRHFLKQLNAASSVLSDELVEHLVALPWPGNVRELRNALEHAIIMAQGGILLQEHFPASFASPGDPDDELAELVRRWLVGRLGNLPKNTTADIYAELGRVVDKTLLAEVMRHVRGNRWQAARLLGLSRTTLRKKLAEFGLASLDSSVDENAQE